MASKCTKCGSADNYNFTLNIGLCDPCIGERIEELEAKIKSANNILNSQSFWCELADKECIGMKSIVYLVEQALKDE